MNTPSAVAGLGSPVRPAAIDALSARPPTWWVISAIRRMSGTLVPESSATM